MCAKCDIGWVRLSKIVIKVFEWINEGSSGAFTATAAIFLVDLAHELSSQHMIFNQDRSSSIILTISGEVDASFRQKAIS